MTVLQIVKDLIGKQDINWGDSSSTFSRETFTGGSTNINYIDAEVIPSTGLSGYIGDHLHVQNTDSLTSTTTFGINSSGNSLVLSSTGLSASRTFTFPDTSNQALIGATDLASIATGLGGALVGIEDAGGYFTGADTEAVLQEVGSDVSTLQTEAHSRGMKNGFRLEYASVNTIYIWGGMWALTGTTNRHVYTNSKITFAFDASNAAGVDPDTTISDVIYVYIDDSAVVASGSSLLTAAQFVGLITEPSWSESKCGWYSGNDRCIGAVLTNSGGGILSFAVFGNNFYRYANPVVEYATAAGAATYTALAIGSSVPKFCTRARLRVMTNVAGASINFDTSGTATTPECYALSHAQIAEVMDAPTNSSQSTYWYGNASTKYDIDVSGYYIDEL